VKPFILATQLLKARGSLHRLKLCINNSNIESKGTKKAAKNRFIIHVPKSLRPPCTRNNEGGKTASTFTGKIKPPPNIKARRRLPVCAM